MFLIEWWPWMTLKIILMMEYLYVSGPNEATHFTVGRQISASTNLQNCVSSARHMTSSFVSLWEEKRREMSWGDCDNEIPVVTEHCVWVNHCYTLQQHKRMSVLRWLWQWDTSSDRALCMSESLLHAAAAQTNECLEVIVTMRYQ